MDQQIKQPPTKDFSSLSEKLRDWLSSIQLMFLIIELNKKLGFAIEKQIIVPRLIWQLVIGEVDPKNFVSELSKQLDISLSAAKSLAQEIEEKMLRPIEIALRTEMGVDTKVIYLAPAAPSPKPPVSPVYEPPRTAPTPPSIQLRPSVAPSEGGPRQAPVPPAIPAQYQARDKLRQEPSGSQIQSEMTTKEARPTLIQTEEAAHPVRDYPAPAPADRSDAGGASSEAGAQEQVRKTVPPPPNQDQQVKLKVNIKRTPTWGSGSL